MSEALLGLFAASLMIFGFVEVFKIISIAFFGQQDLKDDFMLLIPVCGRKETIEMTLRNAVTDAKWFGDKNGPRQIICLDLGLDAETREICKIFSEEYEFIELHSLQTFNEAMEQSVVNMR